ncbi:condensation domain-containing protein, partial [Oleiphilus sp. HI0132]
MRQHDAIDDCALSVREVRAGDTRLIAYVVWKNSPISLSELREHLRQQLPPYMVPQHLEALGELPRTLNNKLDRKALESLPLSESSSLGKEEVRAATTATELKLLSIWQEVINKPISNINENFFDLGGHSLLIAQIIHRVEMDMSVQLKFSDLYEFADIESLAKKIDQSQHTEQSTITKRSENEPALLTLAQQRLWYLNQLEGSSTAYNLPSAFRLKGKLNKLALNQAFQNLISRQEALSAEVIEIDSQPHQRLRNISNFELSEVSFADIDKPIERELELKKRLTVLQNQVFDINHDILFKAELIILSEEESILFFMPHHIIFDGWSFDLFIHELSESYNAYCCGINAQLPVLDYQFADYANWSRLNSSQEDVEKDVSYWVEHLQGAPNLDMPLDRPRPETQDIRGEQVSFELPSDLLSRLNGLALEKDVTLFMVMMASYCALLAKYTDQEDLVIATPMADRTKPGTEDLIGFFVNALVLRFRLSREMPFLELLQQVKQQCLEGFDHMRAPFEKIVERLNPERDISRAPIYQTSITYQDVSKREQVMGSGDHTINIKQCEIPSHDSPLDLNIWFKKRGDSLSGAIVYSTSLFTEKTIQGFRDHFLTILGQIAQNPITRLCDIELLNQSSSKQVMRQCIGPAHAWHEEQANAPRTVGHYLHHQAQQFAEKDAVIFEQEVLSYRQLDELSSQWAQLLLEEHVSVGDRVGLCL